MKKHLESRGVQFHRYPTLSYDDEVVVFPLYTPTGWLIGYQAYRPNQDKTKKNNEKYGRYYTRVSESHTSVFGYESLKYAPDYTFVVEGVFKAVKFHRFELPCLAVLGNSGKSKSNQLRLLNRKLISVCDFGDSGKSLASLGDESYTMSPKNVDDMTDEEFLVFLREQNLDHYLKPSI